MPFARILRSSALMGGAQVVTMATAFLRSKLIAVLIGPSGIGLMGMFTGFNGNLATITSWSLGTSAVRLVSGASDSGRDQKIAAVRKFGWRLTWCGLFAVLVLVLPIGEITFDGQKYALELLIAGLAVPCLIATTMWSSLLQAAGHIGSLARTQILSSLLGLTAGLPFIYFFGPLGIAISILIAALITAAVTWQAAARFCPSAGAATADTDLRELLHLGLIMQIGGILGAVSAYAVRILILRSHGTDLEAGLADAGFYQAAFAVTGTLPGVIFSATSSDFYPRVTAAKDEDEARVITEKQVLASLLLALPILMGLLTMGPLAVRLLYAKGFEPAVPLLDWFVWGIFCNLLGWPLGFWVVARRSKRMVAIFQSLVSVLMVILAFILVPRWGVKGAAIANLGSGLIFTLILLGLTRWVSGRWISLNTVGWLGLGLAILLSGKLFIQLASGGYWGLLPTTLTSAACGLIYFKVIARAKAEEVSA